MRHNIFRQMRTSTIFFTCLFALSAAEAGFAEDNLSNTITIDRIIVPQERAATRMAINPVLLPPRVKEMKLDFTEYSLPSDITRTLLFTAPYAWGDSAEPDRFRGTGWLGYLPLYNLTAGVSYRAIDTPESLLKLTASFDGHWYRWKDNAIAPDGESRTHNFVRENKASLSADFIHRIGNKPSYITAGIDYTYFKGSYNSPWGYTSHEAGDARNCFYTKANILNLSAGYQGVVSRNNLYVKARASYFGFGEPRDRVYSDKLPAVNETGYGVSAGLQTCPEATSSLSVDASADFYSYGKRASMMTMPVWDETGETWTAYSAIGRESGQTRMLVSVVPAYVLHSDVFDARLGVKLDISTHSAKSLHVAPAVNISYVPNAQFAVYAKATGGEYVNTLSRIWQISHFADPSLVYGNSRIPLHIEGGINIGKWKGLTGEISVAYARADDWLLPAVMPQYANFFRYTDVKAWIIGVKAAYDIRDIAGLEASFRVIPGSQDNVYYQWHDRASSVGDIRFWVRPVKALDVSVSAEYRADRKIYMQQMMDEMPVTVSLRDAFVLNLDARYRISDRWTAFAELRNITAKKYYDNFLIGAQCFGGHIGAVYRF